MGDRGESMGRVDCIFAHMIWGKKKRGSCVFENALKPASLRANSHLEDAYGHIDACILIHWQSHFASSMYGQIHPAAARRLCIEKRISILI